jgi:molybdopterin converting factor small subunit
MVIASKDNGRQGRGDAMIIVKVKYFQLSRAVEAKEEDFVLPPDSHCSDLLAAVLKKHPSLTHIAMLVLVNGLPPTPTTELGDGEEIDFFASPMGG